MSLSSALEEISKKAEKAVLKVGFLAGSMYPDGTSTALVAAVHEYGSDHVPARPFFRPAIAAHRDEWGQAFVAAMTATGFDVKKAMTMTGLLIMSDIQQAIVDVPGPALSPVTLLLRQRFWTKPDEITGKDVRKAKADIAAGVVPKVTGTQAKPLIWTGHMKNSVEMVIES